MARPKPLRTNRSATHGINWVQKVDYRLRLLSCFPIDIRLALSFSLKPRSQIWVMAENERVLCS